MKIFKKSHVVIAVACIALLQACTIKMINPAGSGNVASNSGYNTNYSARYTPPTPRKNIKQKKIFKSDFDIVWEALLIHIDEGSFNAVEINEPNGKLVVIEHSDTPSDLKCGSYTLQNEEVASKNATTNYTYRVTKITDNKTSLTINIDGRTSWQIYGKNQASNQRHGIKNNNCISAGTFETPFFKNISKNIKIIKNQEKSDKRKANRSERKNERLTRIEAKRQKKADHKETKLAKKTEKKAATKQRKAEKVTRNKNKQQKIVAK